MKKLLVILLSLLLVISLGACGKKEDPAPSGDGGDEQKLSGSVMLYSSMSEVVLQALQTRFMEVYPDIQFDYVQAGSGKIAAKLTTELQANSVECDIVWLADASEFVEYKNAGNLVPYESPYAATVDPMFRDADNTYIGARAVLTGFVYSPTKIGDGLVPKSWKELLDPSLKDEILMTDAGASGSMKTWLYALVNHPDYGWEFFEELKANGLVLESGTTATHNKVADGSYKVGVGVDFVAKNLIAEGANVAWQDVEQDAIAYYSPIAIVKGCPNEELAKVLYDFIMNPDEGQKVLADNNITPVQPSTPIPAGMYSVDWITEHAVKVDVAKMAAESEEMLAKYDSIFK